MHKSKFTVLQHDILRFLFMNAGKTFNARALSMELKVSQTAVSKALPALENRGLVFVSKDRTSKRLSIQLNRENDFVIGLKRSDNIKQLYESGLAEFLKNNFPGCAVIVFGSFSKGEDTYKSDIDIAVIGTRERNTDLHEFEKTIRREIRISFLRSFKMTDRNLRNNILGGILLSGWIEL